MENILFNNFDLILKEICRNGGLFFYNPIEKVCIIGTQNEFPKEVAINDYRITGIDFYALPFFKEIPPKSDGLWDSVRMGKIEFSYYYRIPYIYDKTNVAKHIKHWENKENDYREWKNLFEIIMKNIRSGGVEKVVASRRVMFSFESDIEITKVVENLIHNNHENFIFAYACNRKVFLGASPEVLVRKSGERIMSYALAGTIAKDGRKDAQKGEELLRDLKNNHEHKVVAEEIAATMRQVSDNVVVGKTELMELKNLFHLKTPIETFDNSLELIDWVRLMHPTPAMGGKPKEKAMEIIRKYEKHDRGLFAAPIGIVDKNGDGIFIVGIRSALIDGKKLYAYAGCGIVEQSDCKEEYEEINNKLRTILEAL